MRDSQRGAHVYESSTQRLSFRYARGTVDSGCKVTGWMEGGEFAADVLDAQRPVLNASVARGSCFLGTFPGET